MQSFAVLFLDVRPATTTTLVIYTATCLTETAQRNEDHTIKLPLMGVIIPILVIMVRFDPHFTHGPQHSPDVSVCQCLCACDWAPAIAFYPYAAKNYYSYFPFLDKASHACFQAELLQDDYAQ